MERSQAAHSRGNLGSLQLEVRLRDETVLSSGCYQPLVQLLCQEVKLGTQVRGQWGQVGGSKTSGLALLDLLNPSCRIAQSSGLGKVPVGHRARPFLWRSFLTGGHLSPCCVLQGPGQLIPVIEETTSTECRQEVATNLLKLFLGQGLAKEFLDLLFQLELGRTSEAGSCPRRGWGGTSLMGSWFPYK